MVIEIPEAPADYDQQRIIERPGGFYWQAIDDGGEFGPFATVLEAISDMEYAEAGVDVGESLQEAESEIGIADWIDPETGGPAEESVPRIEDH